MELSDLELHAVRPVPSATQSTQPTKRRMRARERRNADSIMPYSYARDQVPVGLGSGLASGLASVAGFALASSAFFSSVPKYFFTAS